MTNWQRRAGAAAGLRRKPVPPSHQSEARHFGEAAFEVLWIRLAPPVHGQRDRRLCQSDQPTR